MTNWKGTIKKADVTKKIFPEIQIYFRLSEKCGQIADTESKTKTLNILLLNI